MDLEERSARRFRPEFPVLKGLRSLIERSRLIAQLYGGLRRAGACGTIRRFVSDPKYYMISSGSLNEGGSRSLLSMANGRGAVYVLT